MDKVSMWYRFLSQDIKQNVLLSSYLGSWWCINFNIYLGWQGEEGKTEIKKLNISRAKRTF